MATRYVPKKAFDLYKDYHRDPCEHTLQVIFDYCVAASTPFEIAVMAYLIHFTENEELQLKILNHLEECAG